MCNLERRRAVQQREVSTGGAGGASRERRALLCACACEIDRAFVRASAGSSRSTSLAVYVCGTVCVSDRGMGVSQPSTPWRLLFMASLHMGES